MLWCTSQSICDCSSVIVVHSFPFAVGTSMICRNIESTGVTVIVVRVPVNWSLLVRMGGSSSIIVIVLFVFLTITRCFCCCCCCCCGCCCCGCCLERVNFNLHCFVFGTHNWWHISIDHWWDTTSWLFHCVESLVCSRWAVSSQTVSAWTSHSPKRILVACLVEASTRLAMFWVANIPFFYVIRIICLITKFRNSVYVRVTVESSHFSNDSFISSFFMNWTMHSQIILTSARGFPSEARMYQAKQKSCSWSIP